MVPTCARAMAPASARSAPFGVSNPVIVLRREIGVKDDPSVGLLEKMIYW